jgi:hypothetical protein
MVALEGVALFNLVHLTSVGPDCQVPPASPVGVVKGMPRTYAGRLQDGRGRGSIGEDEGAMAKSRGSVSALMPHQEWHRITWINGGRCENNSPLREMF